MLTAPKDGRIQLPLAAHYPVLRTAIESASLGVWAVAPEERRERVKRVLQVRISDLKEDGRLVRVFTNAETPDGKAETIAKQRKLRAFVRAEIPKKHSVREVGEAPGIAFDEISSGHPGFGPILSDIGPTLGPGASAARGAWGFLSGLSHSSFRRMLYASDVEKIASDGDNRAWLTTKPSVTAMALDAAMLARVTHLNLIANRSGNEEFRREKLPIRRTGWSFTS
ncbi:hypothetical protein [Leifsonia sp. PS1209]|uniref:hypothetical protein n=1 Tax=Leifsonia sp. PS1209 TaxID=2724914 RepID=UPI001442E19D|nr:hypothetical protein [Leifsonia sp. PS1209]QIZ97832.1 hypothetical protein HF024_04390 [Leifsonia sp. PS1209]